MMLAETIGVAAEDINPQVVDTDSIGYTGGTGGSSVTHKIGVTTHQLGLELRKKVSQQLADYWEMDASDISLSERPVPGQRPQHRLQRCSPAAVPAATKR